MRFTILGPLGVTRDGERVALGGPKQRLVLAHLLIRANDVVSAELLIDEIWGDEPPDAARPSLHAYVSHLRKALGADRLVSRPPGYVLQVTQVELNSARFESLVKQARRRLSADPASASRALHDALSLWQGEPLADLAAEQSLQAEIERLSEMRLGAEEDRIEAELALGRHAELVPELERLVRWHSLRERLHGQLMLALYRAGRQADALAAYHKLRRALDSELGLDPSTALEELQRQILMHDPGLQPPGEPLRGYRILEQIGSGPLGVVHRAVEPQTEREVAVKVLGARIANGSGFVRRFDGEAGVIARLEHPHVVPLYDWWREPDGAYLVSRLMRGGALADRLAAGQVSSVDGLRWTEQVGAALAAAHRQGVVHGDVRPGNVLLDGEGNAYLADFAAGYDAAAPNGSDGRVGSPYLAPERRAGGERSAAADVYAFGILLGELFRGASLGNDGAELRAVLERATSSTPGDRHPNAADAAAAVRRALLAPTRTTDTEDPLSGPTRNPYKGLRAFEEADARDFFGRSDLVGQLVARLGERGEASRLLAVVGPSGSGKSSVVHAGLIPALRAGTVEGSDQWFIASMTPGERPFETLERTLLGLAVDVPPSLVELVEASEGLRSAIERVLPPGMQLLLVIDQFEELFTLTHAHDRARFLDSLARTIDDPAARIRVVVTLRADFYDRPLSHERFGRQLATRTHAVPPLTPGELERVVVEPAGRAGLRLEQGLATRIVAAMSEQPGGLPLLQYALTELWERRDGSRLSARAFDASGGIAGAVSRRAEELVLHLDPAGEESARQLFLRLVEPGEGTPDTARRLLSSELHAFATDRHRVDAVIESFVRYRLLLVDRDEETREPTLELAHEALLTVWPRLQHWVDEARDDLRTQRRLAAASAQWLEDGREPSFLLTGNRLEQTAQWVASTRMLLAPGDREFVAASVAQQQQQEAQEEDRRAREAVLERRAVNRLRALVGVLALGIALAGGLSVFAVGESQRASREARAATARGLAAEAVVNAEIDTDRSVLLALEAVEAARSADESVLLEAEEALHTAVVASRAIRTIPDEGGHVAWTETPDGTSAFVTAGPEESGLVRIRDATSGTVIHELQAHDTDVNDVAFSRDGSMLATTGDDGALRVWSTTTGLLVRESEGAGPVWGPAFSPDGSQVAASWWDDGTVRLLDLETGRLRKTGQSAVSLGTSFSPDGTRLATSMGEPLVAVLLDVATLDPVMTLDGNHEAGDLAFSPDGRWIAASTGEFVRIWNAATGAHHHRLAGHLGEVLTIDWSPDSGRLLTGGRDGTARLWEIGDDGYRDLLPFSTLAMPGGVDGVAFSPDGESVLTGDLVVSEAKIWDVGLQGDAESANLVGEPVGYGGISFLSDGRLAAGSGKGTVTFWDVAARTPTFTTTQHADYSEIAAIEPSPDGQLIATGGFDGVRLWDPATGNGLKLGSDIYRAVAWSANGGLVAVALLERPEIFIFDRSGEKVRTLAQEPEFRAVAIAINKDGVLAAAERPDGRAVGPAHRVTMWDLNTGAVIRSIPAPLLSDSIAFDPTGTRLATAFISGRAEVWDLNSNETLTLPGHAGDVAEVIFSSDGTRIATSGEDGTVRLWDGRTGEPQLVLRGHATPVLNVRFSPDGSRLASLGSDGLVRVWALDLDDLIGIARRNVTRQLSDEECQEYLGRDSCGEP